jgi:hypothetical protein
MSNMPVAASNFSLVSLSTELVPVANTISFDAREPDILLARSLVRLSILLCSIAALALISVFVIALFAIVGLGYDPARDPPAGPVGAPPPPPLGGKYGIVKTFLSIPRRGV